jgi:hypothetical protein
VLDLVQPPGPPGWDGAEVGRQALRGQHAGMLLGGSTAASGAYRVSVSHPAAFASCASPRRQ